MLKKTWRWSTRILLSASLLAGLFFAATVLGLRYWILPNIGQYRGDIATLISAAAGQPVSIERISADWDGLRPRLVMEVLRIHDSKGNAVLQLDHVENTLSWWSLLAGDIRLHSLEINAPTLLIRRNITDRLFVAGIEVGASDSDSGFTNWLMQQRRIIIRNATLVWQDEKRDAPPLELKSVNLRLENSGGRHRFGLRAIPPQALAGPLDIRGDLRGENFQELASWRGTLFTQLDRTDLAAWGAWLTLPFDLNRGNGGIRAWVGVEAGNVKEITADVHLNGVSTRLAADLPWLDLKVLDGRLGWRALAPGYEFRAQKLSLESGDGQAMLPASLIARYIPASGQKPAQGELQVNGISLEPLANLSEHLPFHPDQRRILKEMDPRGNFGDLAVKWRGEWGALQQYSVKGRFANLGMKTDGKWPGFTGISGNIDANEKGGTLSLQSRDTHLTLAEIFRAPLELDALTAQMSWKIDRQGELALKLSNATFSNAHLAGTAFGTYQTQANTPGSIDLTGHLTRADARQTSAYLPLVIGLSTREWLSEAILAGRSDDVRLRLKGNLADFPFADGKSGLFEVAAKVSNGTLEYGKNWPRIENISLDLLFRGARMEITAHQGNTYGMRLGKTRAIIPDLITMDEQLEVTGEAQGPTADMLKFIERSPVNAMIDGFTETMRASGDGRLALGIRLPLRHLRDTRISGSYQFLHNRVAIDESWPALEQVSGKLVFTESGVEVPQITAQALGGSLLIGSTPQKDGSIKINLQGRATAAGLARTLDHPAATQVLSGATDWRGTVSIRKKTADIVVESSLAGLASSLPAPFAKKAAEVTPLRLEKKSGGSNPETLHLAYNKVLDAIFVRRPEAGQMVVERGMILFGGGAAPIPLQSGIWLNGELRALDIDQWRSLIEQGAPAKAALPLAGFNLKFGSLDMFGKRFGELRVNGHAQGNGWQVAAQGKELAGDITWRPEGRGRINARLKYLTLPDAIPPTPGVAAAAAPESRDLPALDIVAENFQAKQKKLGKLELSATHEEDDWRIDKLKLSNPDATLQMEGFWQGWRRKPTTRVNLVLEVQDVGKLLVRLGYPDAVRRGTARLEGQLSWQGNPQEVDYASLSGTMKLDAHSGQFAKIEPGIGKLLGILSLQALPRRITLDFRDVFSEGFAFDDISGTLRANRGIVSSDDFRIDGAAAKVTMKGETNLAMETQNLRVRVLPAIGASVSMAGALLGHPVVGLTTLLVQKLLKDPLDQIASYEYSITGTWDNPNVNKVTQQPDTAHETN